MLLGAALLGRAPRFTGLDSLVPSRGCSGGKLCEVIRGLCAGPSAGQVPAVAWPVRSSLSCCLAPVRSGPAAAWSQRNQAPVGCLAPTKLRAVRPTGLHGDCRHDQPCPAHARTSRQPCVELPARKLCGETGPSHNHPRPRAVHLAVVPEIQAWSGEGNARVLDLCWGRRCHPARVEAQNGKFVRHSRTLTTRTASAG